MIRRNESEEDYLEAILMLKEQNGAVRSIDVAHHMDFSKPSVSRAMGILKNEGMITMDEIGQISLTPEGRKKAESIYERHKTITAFLSRTLCLDPSLTEEDACRMEHILSQEVFEKMKEYVEKTPE